jgi:hypothetical protein
MKSFLNFSSGAEYLFLGVGDTDNILSLQLNVRIKCCIPRDSSVLVRPRKMDRIRGKEKKREIEKIDREREGE